jgi:hypothetical protein
VSRLTAPRGHEPDRLHVDGQRSGLVQLLALLGAANDLLAAGNRADVDPQAAALKHAGEDRRVIAADGAVGTAQLAGQHDVARLERRVERPAETGDQDRAGAAEHGTV